YSVVLFHLFCFQTFTFFPYTTLFELFGTLERLYTNQTTLYLDNHQIFYLSSKRYTHSVRTQQLVGQCRMFLLDSILFHLALVGELWRNLAHIFEQSIQPLAYLLS